MEKRPIIVIDGMNIFVRFFMVNESMSSKSEPVGGVVGFIKYLDLIIDRWAPSKVIIVWESGGGSQKRKKIHENYKSGSGKVGKGKSFKDDLKKDVENKVKQLTMLYNVLKKTPICQIFIKDTECDDVIGYLIKYELKKQPAEKIIMSSDKDFYQLLEDRNVKIYDPGKKITIDHNFVKEKFGISANNFCLARTFVGDASDNIEGVPGIGLKTIAKRFDFLNDEEKNYTVAEVITSARELFNSKSGKGLKSIKEMIDCEQIAARNWRLMYLNMSNLTIAQIEKIKGALETHNPKMDKLGFIKEVVSHGINMSFDYDRFCRNLVQNLIFN